MCWTTGIVPSAFNNWEDLQMSFVEGIGEGCGFFIGKAVVPVIIVVVLLMLLGGC